MTYWDDYEGPLEEAYELGFRQGRRGLPEGIFDFNHYIYESSLFERQHGKKLEELAWEHHGGGTWEQMTDQAPDESYDMVFDAFIHGLDTGYFMDDDVAEAL